MATLEAQKNGGQVMALRQRQEAILKYNSNPNYCKQCKQVIEVKGQDKVSHIRKKVFCNSSCSAIWNNINKIRKPRKICPDCGKPIQKINLRCLNCKKNYTKITQGNRTKGNLFSSRNGYQSARTAIRQHADVIYEDSGKLYKCKICNYDLHVEICHIKSVSSFPESATLNEINNIDNLITLCPTHHWEFDNKVITL